MNTFSVIIPAYNAERYLADAIESALAQTAPASEILVIDDGSTDGTVSIAHKFGSPVRCVTQTNSGVAAARNRGIRESTGRYVAFLDADDAWMPEKLERQLQAMTATGLRAAHAALLVVDDGLQPLFDNRDGHVGGTLENLLMIGNVVGTPSTVICERAIFADIGGFDPTFSLCADWEMWIRIATVTSFAFVDSPLVRYRLHGDNMSLNVALLESDSNRTLGKAFSLARLPEDIRRRRRTALARNWMVLAGSYFRAAQRMDALRCGIHAMARDPQQVRELLAFGRRVASGTTGIRSVTQRRATAR